MIFFSGLNTKEIAMARQITTAVSDALLAWSVLYFIYNVFWSNFFACLGLAIQGVAATLGIVRFSQMRQAGQIYDYHRLTSELAGVNIKPFTFIYCILLKIFVIYLY